MAFINEKINNEMFEFYNQFHFKSDGYEKSLVAADGDDWWVNREEKLYFIEAGQMR